MYPGEYSYSGIAWVSFAKLCEGYLEGSEMQNLGPKHSKTRCYCFGLRPDWNVETPAKELHETL